MHKQHTCIVQKHFLNTSTNANFGSYFGSGICNLKFFAPNSHLSIVQSRLHLYVIKHAWCFECWKLTRRATNVKSLFWPVLPYVKRIRWIPWWSPFCLNLLTWWVVEDVHSDIVYICSCLFVFCWGEGGGRRIGRSPLNFWGMAMMRTWCTDLRSHLLSPRATALDRSIPPHRTHQLPWRAERTLSNLRW